MRNDPVPSRWSPQSLRNGPWPAPPPRQFRLLPAEAPLEQGSIGLTLDAATGAAIGVSTFAVFAPGCLSGSTEERSASSGVGALAVALAASGLYWALTGRDASGVAGMVSALGAFAACKLA